MRSLATEHLREIESLVGPEYQNKEDIIKITLGSIFLGKGIIFMDEALYL